MIPTLELVTLSVQLVAGAIAYGRLQQKSSDALTAATAATAAIQKLTAEIAELRGIYLGAHGTRRLRAGDEPKQ